MQAASPTACSLTTGSSGFPAQGEQLSQHRLTGPAQTQDEEEGRFGCHCSETGKSWQLLVGAQSKPESEPAAQDTLSTFPHHGGLGRA